jgi:hypothetical protein
MNTKKYLRKSMAPKNHKLAKEAFELGKYTVDERGAIDLGSWANIVKLARSTGLKSKKARAIRKRAKKCIHYLIALGMTNDPEKV